MVAGKVRVAMGLQKSPANQKQETPPKPPMPSPSSGKNGSQKSLFSRSFGVSFQRSSAQVQPRPPDVSELLRLVEELRERESMLKTELLGHKLLKESVAIVPVLESEISQRAVELGVANEKIERLEAENDRLEKELREVKEKFEEERGESEKKVEELETEIAKLKKTASDCTKVEMNVQNEELSSSQRFQGSMEISVKSNIIRNLKKTNRCEITVNTNQENHRAEIVEDLRRDEAKSERPRHYRSKSEELAESTLINLRSRVPRVPKPPPRPSSSSPSSPTSSDAFCPSIPPPPLPPAMKSVPPPPPLPPAMKSVAPLRPNPPAMKSVPPPPPYPPAMKSVPPPPPPPVKTAPPPPPPPLKGIKGGQAKVRRVPEVVEFYRSLMRRDSRRDSASGTTELVPATLNARDMIGEIENRSTHLLAVKTDVETQGDFIRFLIKEVESAAFTNIDDVVLFVKWLDDELSYLVDERAVLKHFEWPEHKADALREVAFGYCDLKKLEYEALSFRDDLRQQCAPALKKMQALLEKLEHGVYNLSRMRESGSNRFKGFQIPTDWMLDTGIVSQMKVASVKLAMNYMKRISAELENVAGGPEEEELIVQGVRFAFRVHQFAGGFDVETMRAFQELRDKASSCHMQCKNQQHQRLACRSTTY